MSRGLIFGGVGAAIGGFLGGPTGAKIGWTLGSYLGAESQNTQGPRLDDLATQTADYGAPIPKVYGKARLAGFVMWAKPLEEVAKTESAGGKGGGPTVTNYTYFGTFAVAIAEGEVDGFIRVWADTDLIYSIDSGSTLEELIASQSIADGITFYTGSETQEADPLIQADQGAANTQAYRGTSYIVFDRLPLENYGNRIPNISVEVSANATPTGVRFVETTQLNNEKNITNQTYGYISGMNALSNGAVSMDVFKFDTLVAQSTATINGYTSREFANPQSSSYLIKNRGVKEPATSSIGSILYTNSFFDNDNVYCCETMKSSTSTATVGDSLIHVAWGLLDTENGSGATNSTIITLRGNFDQILIDAGYSGYYYKGAVTTQDQEYLYLFLSISQSTISDWVKIDKSKNIVASGGWSSDPNHALMMIIRGTGDRSFMSIEPNNDYLWSVRLTGSTATATCWSISDISLDFVGSTTEVLNDDGNWGDAIAFDGGVITGYTKDGYWHYSSFTRLPYYTGATTTLKAIVDDILDTAGVSDYDTTALTDSVTGYIRTKQMSGRSAIQPLQQAFLFDSYENGSQLVFTKRGGASVVSIPEIDLGAGQNQLLTHTRQEDSELPSKVIINYIDIDTDYEKGSQQYQRINANQDNIITLDLPIVMTGDRAKQLAEILMFNAWTERDKFNISLSSAYLAYNPTNVITVTANDYTRVMRITKMSYGSILEAECVSEDAQVYSSDAVAGDGGFIGQTVGLKGHTLFKYLDIPMLRNEDNDEGVYIAAAGYFSSWTGSEIYKSTDSGATYSPVLNIFNSATIGVTSDVLADAGTSLLDTVSTVNISLSSGNVSSITQAAMLNGGNYALIGSEAVNFQNATLESDGTYTLDTFIRGGRGTEWATSSHVANENFILLDEDTIRRMSAAYNTARSYKAVTFGTYLDDAIAESNTNTGISLKPFSPTFIRGSRDGSSNLTITWLRRSRYIASGFNTQPLLEETEYYKIEILDGIGGSVLATYNSTSESYSYSAAQQTTDGVTLGGPCYVKIYQNSDIVGYGYGREETL